MRIIDWSSDVCSSDLERDRAVLGPVSRAGLGGRQRYRRSHLVQYFGKRHVLAFARIEPVAFTQLDEIGSSRDLLPDCRDAAVDHIACIKANHFIGQLRSDEHTSELQSLMRTSHAVFCLKN